MAEPCPICETGLRKSESREYRYFYECPRCGPFSLSREAKDDLGWYLSRTDGAALKLSYALYRMTKREMWAMLTGDLLKDIISQTELPRPQGQLENLIIWLGENQPNIGSPTTVVENVISASGAADMSVVGFLISQAIMLGIVEGKVTPTLAGKFSSTPIKLTMKGWGLFEELQRGKASGRNAFMAMKFGDPELDGIFKDHFKQAVKDTGFDLKRLDEGQPAGLIDDRMRVEIRQSRFLIADLTHNNNGAYWEAGYAEGLGKPVIYTCRKDVFDNKTQGTHFDTNHHLTVAWEPDKLTGAAEKLKATIRATLPEEAKLSD